MKRKSARRPNYLLSEARRKMMKLNCDNLLCGFLVVGEGEELLSHPSGECNAGDINMYWRGVNHLHQDLRCNTYLDSEVRNADEMRKKYPNAARLKRRDLPNVKEKG